MNELTEHAELNQRLTKMETELKEIKMLLLDLRNHSVKFSVSLPPQEADLKSRRTIAPNATDILTDTIQTLLF